MAEEPSSTPESHHERKPTWVRGCLVPLVVAVAILGAVVYGLLQLRARSLAGDQRIQDEWVTPWSEAVRRDRLADVWERLTTERYRRSRTLEATRETYREATRRWGPPRAVTIQAVSGTHDVLSGRSFDRTVTSWAWERGTHLYITFELVETAEGYRVDDAYPGGGPARVNPLPADTPDGPW